MTRTYELAFIIDSRVSDDDAAALVDEYKGMLEANEGLRITKEESWGKRKLAYPINKLKEGRYIFLYLEIEGGGAPFSEVEHRMRQNDKILRFLTIRTDKDLKRSASKGKVQPEAAGEAATSDDEAQKGAA